MLALAEWEAGAQDAEIRSVREVVAERMALVMALRNSNVELSAQDLEDARLFIETWTQRLLHGFEADVSAYDGSTSYTRSIYLETPSLGTLLHDRLANIYARFQSVTPSQRAVLIKMKEDTIEHLRALEPTSSSEESDPSLSSAELRELSLKISGGFIRVEKKASSG